MNHEHLLNDFIDGLLDEEAEATLFAELHFNEPLRANFKTLLLMQRGVHHDMDAYVPPAASTSAIFQRLGFSRAEDASRSFLPFAGRTGAILHGLIGAALGALLMLLFMTWRNGEFDTIMASTPDTRSTPTASPTSSGRTRPPSAAKSTTPPEVATGSPPSGSLPSGSLPSGSLPSGSDTDRPSRSIESLPTPKVVIVNQGNASATPTARAVADAPPTPSVSVVTTVEPATIEETQAPATEAAAPPSATLTPDLNRSPKLPWEQDSFITEIPVTMEYRSIASRAFETLPSEIDISPNALLNNSGIAAYYRVNEDNWLGLEVGQEQFYQKFNESRPNGDVVQHRQNPAFIWAGVSYRYRIRRSTGLNPFVQTFLGFTEVGPVGKLMLGGGYEILPELRLFAGAEITALTYRYQSQWYVAPKYGLAYGCSINF